jgi:ankyrin repeat protein
MSAQQLPERPDLAQLRRLAKELRDAVRGGDPAAAERVARHLPAAADPLPLTSAQLVIAREHGFPSWARLKAAVEGAKPSLHDAVEANDVELVRLLLERGADPGDGHTLSHAAGHRDHECLRLLIEHGAAVRGSGALAGVIGRDDVEGVRILVAAGADPGRPHPGVSAPAGILPDMTENPLTAAAQRDSADVVAALLEAGADPSAPCRDGHSAVRAAVRRGRPEVAEVLLRHGAGDDVDDVDRLLGACARADRAGAEALLARHPGLVEQLTGEDGAIIVDVAEAGDAAAVRLMLELGFPPGATRGMDGGAALHAAAYLARTDVIRLLLDVGADVEQLDRQWHSTPLCWAAVGSGEQRHSGRPEDWLATVRVLLDAGASAGRAWVDTKPPSDEVAALLRAAAAPDSGRPSPAADRPAADPARLGQVAERLRRAFETGDADLLGTLLHPDVRWGGGPRGCWNHGQVLEWYGVLRDRLGSVGVSEVVVREDAVELHLAGGRSQTFTVADGLVVEISG